MTVLIGMVHDGTVYLGADRSAVDAEALVVDTMARPKVWIEETHGEKFVVGAAESFRLIQLLQYALDIPERPPTWDHHAWLLTAFIPELRKCLSENGFFETGESLSLPGPVFLGFDGHLYHIQGDYAAVEIKRHYDGVGTGAASALGALAAFDLVASVSVLDPIFRMALAMEAAAQYTFTVAGPFDVVGTDGTERQYGG